MIWKRIAKKINVKKKIKNILLKRPITIDMAAWRSIERWHKIIAYFFGQIENL